MAEELNTSTVTVSNALSGKPGLSSSLRESIINKAEEMGYFVKKKSLSEQYFEESRQKAKKSVAIGVIVSKRYISVGTSFYWEMYQKVAKQASKQNAFTMIEILDDETLDSMTLPQSISSGRNNGLIILGKLDLPYLKSIVQCSTIPVVTMDYYSPSLKCDFVLSNNEGGMYKTTKYLIDHGHRDIAFVGDTSENGNFHERYLGYEDALREEGIPIRKEWVISDRDEKTQTPNISLPKNMPTAFACSADYTAGFLYSALEEKGYKVPNDISVSSYDDFLFGNPFGRVLTTFHVDMERMAEVAIKLLRDRIENGTKEHDCIRAYVEGYMVERESVMKL